MLAGEGWPVICRDWLFSRISRGGRSAHNARVCCNIPNPCQQLLGCSDTNISDTYISAPQKTNKQNKTNSSLKLYKPPCVGIFAARGYAFVCTGLKRKEFKVTAVVINTVRSAALTMPRAHRHSTNTHFVSNSEFPARHSCWWACLTPVFGASVLASAREMIHLTGRPEWVQPAHGPPAKMSDMQFINLSKSYQHFNVWKVSLLHVHI